MTRRRVVVLAPSAPVDASPDAGGRYLQILVTTLQSRADVTVITPNTPSARAASAAAGAPASVIVADRERPSSLRQRAVRRLVAVAQVNLGRLDPGLPPLSLGAAILRRGSVRDAIAAADVVDLQWSETIRLARLVRRVNPQARMVGTFHDVQSQLFARRPAATFTARLRRNLAVALSRSHERRAVARLDEVVVFSSKDAHLLGDPPHVRVVHPPLSTGEETPTPAPAGPPTAVFVAYFARQENQDAVRWLLREVWPRVRAAVPDARLRLVGLGIPVELAHEVARYPDLEAVGFVPDLDAELDRAHVALVPLRQGAGVKFKTLEALLRGVPVVGTSVGIEGIEGPDLFAGVADDVEGFAQAVVDALTEPGRARARAATAQAWASRVYSRASFDDVVADTYAIG